MLVAMAGLPTTPIGKIDKKAIARQFGGTAEKGTMRKSMHTRRLERPDCNQPRDGVSNQGRAVVVRDPYHPGRSGD
jgi:hypothetical protein